MSRKSLLHAVRKAAEILEESNARELVQGQGLTRIDPFKLAAWANVPVMLRPMQKLLGAYVNEGRPGIILNSERPRGLVQMTCAHELGHYFLGHEPRFDEQIEYGYTAEVVEQEADNFARALLVPSWIIPYICRRKAWSKAELTLPSVIYQLSLRLGLSYSATVWTLANKNLIARDHANRIAGVTPADIKKRLIGPGDLSDAGVDVWHLSPEDRGLVLEPDCNDHFVVDLPNHSASGLKWSLRDAEEQGFQLLPRMQNIDHDVALQPPTEWDRVGSNGRMEFDLLRDGEIDEEHLPTNATVVLEEARVFSNDREPNDRLELQAQFRQIRKGLAPESKSMQLQQVAQQND